MVKNIMYLSFNKFLPVAALIGVLAAFSIVLTNGLAGTAWAGLGALWPGLGAVWAIFVSWGMYFLAGAKPSRLHKEVIGLTGGILFGYATLYAATAIGFTYLPVVVFFAAFFIVLLELTDWFELAPAYFLSYAGYFAFVFGNFGGPATTAENALLPFWILTMIGLGFGYVSASLRKKILEKEGVWGTAQETVFDKESRSL